MDSRAWYALSVEEVALALKANIVSGLAPEEAASRLETSGPNRLPQHAREPFIRKVVRQFTSPIALTLVIAAPAAAAIGTVPDALVIATALLINVVIGVFQEERAANAFAALQKREAKHAVVMRAGGLEERPAAQVVSGDVVMLSAGSAVPADIRLIEVHGLATNESALSGEWGTVAKTIKPVPLNAPLVERSCMAYAGTFVASGTGKGLVVATGVDTEFGKIAASLAAVHAPETPLAHDLRKAGQLLFLLAMAAIIGVFTLALFRGESIEAAILIAIAIAVSSVPEGLPAAVTVSLALGMERILHKGGLVRGLLAAETLGATSVILTDKTGTLTEGKMRVTGFATPHGTTEESTGDEAKQVLRGAILASDGFIEVETLKESGDVVKAHGRPIEQAIVLSGYMAGVSESALRTECPRLDELPFSAERRFGGMLVEEAGHPVAYLSGAPEVFLAHVKRADGTARAHALTPAAMNTFVEALHRAAQGAERVIAVVRAHWTEPQFPEEASFDTLLDRAELLGFIIFSDPLRSEAKQAVADMQAAGARVIMATGDNPDTALAVAHAAGIARKNAHVHTGAEMRDISDDALYKLLMQHTIFARVTPQEKLRIANVLSGRGEVVAMTGDGVNDAPALHAAAIGVALGSGTEVAKEASDLVLLNDSFSVITTAIMEGRRLRDNVKKTFTFLVATNFSEAIIIIMALAFGLPLPLLPAQVLWANLINGGAMNVAFAFEPLYPSTMRRSPKDPESARIFSSRTIQLILLIGLTTGALLIALLAFLQASGLPEAEIRTVMFAAVSFDAIFTALSLKSFGTPLWKIPLTSNRFLLYALGASIALLLAALFVPPVAVVIHATALSAGDLILLAGLGVLDLALVETIKYALFIRPDRTTAAQTA